MDRQNALPCPSVKSGPGVYPLVCSDVETASYASAAFLVFFHIVLWYKLIVVHEYIIARCKNVIFDTAG